MKVMAWNARGIARLTFQRNLSQAVKDHYLALVLISETRVSKENALMICDNLPFSSTELDQLVTLEVSKYCGIRESSRLTQSGKKVV